MIFQFLGLSDLSIKTLFTFFSNSSFVRSLLSSIKLIQNKSSSFFIFKNSLENQGCFLKLSYLFFLLSISNIIAKTSKNVYYLKLHETIGENIKHG